MWNGKSKAITFSFDDGVTQDSDLIKILDDYGLKATFNLNSGFLGGHWSLKVGSVPVVHNKILPEKVKDIYKNHEVAAHTVHHYCLPTLSDEEIVKEVEEDVQALENLVGYELCGMAYPCDGVNNDDRVAEVLRKHTKMQYARTITSTHSFDLQTNLMRFNPTVYYIETEKMFALAEKFLAMETEEDKTFYIWGHAYEMDGDLAISWKEFERFCKLISGKKDIFYGTNKEVLLYK